MKMTILSTKYTFFELPPTSMALGDRVIYTKPHFSNIFCKIEMFIKRVNWRMTQQ